MIRFLACIFVCIMSSLSMADGFVLDSIAEAEQLSKLSNRPILLILGSNRCVFCEMLKDEIISGDINNHIQEYIVCYIDLEKNKTLKKTYNVNIIPDSRIIKKQKITSKITGFDKKKYIKWLEDNE